MIPRASIWYFPGDQPAFETLATFSLLLATALVVLGVIAFLVTIPKASSRFRRPLLRLVLVLMCLVVLPLVVAILGIGRRHFGEWAELKALIRHYSDLVTAEVEKSGDATQLPALEARLFDPPPTFQFTALREPVTIAMASRRFRTRICRLGAQQGRRETSTSIVSLEVVRRIGT